ncbi:MAG: universal stress protein [Gemmatimonadaceae bacterium]|nr:universal stress protein [Gemmatimonadaceae bacterium]
MRPQHPPVAAVPYRATLPAPAGTPFARLLAASDGSEAAEGALRVAAALAARDQAELVTVSVVEPVPYGMPIPDIAIAVPMLPVADPAMLTARRDAIAAQAMRCGARRPVVTVETAMPVQGILQAAAQFDADLVILGIGRHGPLDRLFGSETALHVVRSAPRATLAVPTTMTAAPTHAIVGMDFSDSALAATRLAARLVGPTGRLTLVHVEPVGEPVPSMLAEWHGIYAEGVQAAFARTITGLGLPRTLQVETVTLAGHAANALLGVIERTRADLVTLGRHSYGAIERLLLGSVTTRVLRSATCAVAVAGTDAPG